MDALHQSYSSALEYPRNIAHSRHYPHVLDSYAKLLGTLGRRLFCEEDKACVDLWQFQGDSQFHHEIVKTHSQLKSYLCMPFPLGSHHPQSRFFFIQTYRNSSREKLNVTKEIMTYILSYHQVMPEFTEVLASFGKDAPHDFQFCGFKSEVRPVLSDRALAVPELNRSGRALELCYSLRAVEPSNSYKGWHWTIKQLGISHSFDLENGQSAWIILKADSLMKDRIMSATRSTALPDMRSFGDRSQSFTSSLSAHLLFCEWAVEHWRWYINFMETQIQDITGTKAFVPVSVPSFAQPGKRLVHETLPTVQRMRARTFTFGRLKRSNTWGSISRSLGLSKNSKDILTGQVQGVNNDNSGNTAMAVPDDEEDEDSSFSYDDLQGIQVIEEKVNEAILVLSTNNKILGQLRGLYSHLDEHEGWPLDLSQKCRGSLGRFEKSVGHIQCELDLQQKRAETLMALLSSRKTLVHGILEWRSMEASKMLAVQSHASTDHMLSMTDEMRELAVKTKQETVSMRIITLVTLFFLPGTFISTFMSTDIVRFDHSKEIFSPAALKLFVAISLPLMFFTFVAWYAVYWWVDNVQRKEKSKQKSSSKV